MFAKEVKATFHNHQIAVRNSWEPTISFKGLSGLSTNIRLYIDGNVVDTSSESFSVSSDVAILRGSIEVRKKIHVVEVYARSVLRTKIKICIDGTKVAGDLP